MPARRRFSGLAWLSRPALIGIMLAGLVLLAGVLSAVFSILAVSPSNPIP